MLLRRITTPVLEENCYLLAAGEGTPGEPRAALVVDPGAGAAERLTPVLREHRLAVRAVALTHGHADHLWDAWRAGSEEGAAETGRAPVYLGGPDLHRLRDPAGALGPGLGEMFTEMAAPHTPGGRWMPPADARPFPGEVLAGGGAELVEGVVLRAVPAPGHTEGSTVLLVSGEVEDPDGVLPDAAPAGERAPLALCGDVIFAGSIGRTDLPGGDEREMTSTLRTLAASLPPSTVLLPGHGPATILSHELRTNAHLRMATGR